jgi:hypothetical protein
MPSVSSSPVHVGRSGSSSFLVFSFIFIFVFVFGVGFIRNKFVYVLVRGFHPLVVARLVSTFRATYASDVMMFAGIRVEDRWAVVKFRK